MKLENKTNAIWLSVLSIPFVLISVIGFIWQFVWSQMVGNVWSIKFNNQEYSFKWFWRHKQ